MPKHKIVYLPIDELESADRNAKAHDMPLIAASMKRFRFVESIVRDDRTGKIISGHGRRDSLIAAREAGEDPPDGVVLGPGGKWLAPVETGWASVDDDEAIAAGIAINQSNIAGGWNYDLLAPDLQLLDAMPGGLDAVGFSHDDLDSILAALELRANAQDEPESEAPPAVGPPAKPVTKQGDMWELGPHRLVCGDCRDPKVVEKLLDGATINLAFTSPPYAEQRNYDESSGFKPIPPDEYVEWFRPVADIVGEHLTDDGSWFVNIKAPQAELDTDLYVLDLVAAHVREWGWHWATEFCWERVGVPKSVRQRFKNQFEPIYQFVKGRWKIRPDAVRHASLDAIVPLGEVGSIGRDASLAAGGRRKQPIHGVDEQGAVGSKSDADRGTVRARNRVSKSARDVTAANVAALQGSGAPGPNAKQRRAANAAAMGEHAQGVPGGPNVGKLETFGKRARTPIAGGGERANYDDESTQGSGDGWWGPGEATGAGWAYPGNRLPTFSGTHTATGHSAAFPVGLPQWFVRAYTDEGDVVFDPFMGSGSTLLAAHNEDRIAYGVELSPGYCDIILRRWQAETGEQPRRVGAKKPTDFAPPAG